MCTFDNFVTTGWNLVAASYKSDDLNFYSFKTDGTEMTDTSINNKTDDVDYQQIGCTHDSSGNMIDPLYGVISQVWQDTSDLQPPEVIKDEGGLTLSKPSN